MYKKYLEFTYWFNFDPNSNSFVVKKMGHSDSERMLTQNLIDTCSELSADWDAYMRRPEYTVHEFIGECSDKTLTEELDISKLNEYVEQYENILRGVCYLRAKENNPDIDPDTCERQVSRIFHWLRATDFYTAPASCCYHEAYKGGLLYHTLRVMSNICSLINVPKFSSVDPVSALLVAMIHDWCKICRYESYEKNVKNETTGAWEKVKAFRRKDPIVPLGHGETSMYYAMKYIRLSLGEALAVRWHMGEYKCEYTEQNELETANMNYPLVYMLQFADRLACTAY